MVHEAPCWNRPASVSCYPSTEVESSVSWALCSFSLLWQIHSSISLISLKSLSHTLLMLLCYLWEALLEWNSWSFMLWLTWTPLQCPMVPACVSPCYCLLMLPRHALLYCMYIFMMFAISCLYRLCLCLWTVQCLPSCLVTFYYYSIVSHVLIVCPCSCIPDA